MGVVYRGFDPRLGRPVAVKIIKGDDPGTWRRFIQEARAQARIEHENVCRVYEAGQADGEPYIVMQLIDGESLSRLRGLPILQGVKLMRDVASAVHEAHRLGLIHRDIKPQNILVERREDGAWKPYVVDFGLAREVAEQGQTATGAVVGTPAYMPPEQALGEVRALDRRSDVYALGATLYDLIAGRPPFVSEHPWQLLMKVAYEDAPALSAAKKGVPADLDTIVMKCLERDPARRYDTARALAEDLQRFLDGDPIRARRASLAYVAWKKARKNKLAAAVAATAFAAAASLGGVWAKGRRDAAEQARLAQALGEDVKGMELFLRNAYGMPLHDVERERDIVRKQLSRVEANMKAAGKVGEGPGHYAMGRGTLALGDPAAARAHLERARAAGYSSAALDYALGQALGELFRRAIEESKRITNEAEREERVRALETTLRDPALTHLRAAVGAEVESPAYVEGLIALYEGKNEEALKKAKEAFAATPWLYEAKKLEGDAEYALGSPYRHDAAFDWDKMMAHFQPAAEAYREAEEIARSDPEVHRAACELWEKIGWAEAARDAPGQASFDEAEAACARAVQASHGDLRARIQRALVLSAKANMLKNRSLERALPVADEAVRAAEEAAQASSGDVTAQYALARALSEQAEVRMALSRPASIEPVIAAYERVVALDPRFTWAVSELGDNYYLAAEIDAKHGRDPRPAFEKAARQYEQALSIDPTFLLAVQKRVKVLVHALDEDVTRGREAESSFAALDRAVDDLEEKMGPGKWLVAFWRARAQQQRGSRALARGQDPRSFARAGLAAIGAAPAAAQKNYWMLGEAVECDLLEARYAIRTGASPDEPLAAARQAMREAAEALGSVTTEFRLLSAEIELASIRGEAARGEGRAESFERAFEQLRPILEKPVEAAEPYQIMAEVHALRALWFTGRGKDARGDLDAGQRLAGEALARNPRSPRALAARGLLSLAEARALAAKGERGAAARRAKEDLDNAFAASPPLARAYEREAKEIAALLP